MEHFIKLILFSDAGNPANNISLLVFRMLLALQLFRAHGLGKYQDNGGKHVPNPLGLPAGLNGFIATFSETVVPFLVIIGVATRLVVIPVIGITGIGYFVIHRNEPIRQRDISYMYSLCFLFLFVMGAGTFSADHYLLLLYQNH